MKKYSVLIKRFSSIGEFYIEVEPGCGDPELEKDPGNIIHRQIVNDWKSANLLAGKLRSIYVGVNSRLN